MKEKKLLGNQRSQQTPSYANQAHNGLPWKSLEQQVVRMQMQISQACQRVDKQAVHTLQQRLMELEAARLLAVRRVTEENQGRHTAGSMASNRSPPRSGWRWQQPFIPGIGNNSRPARFEESGSPSRERQNGVRLLSCR